MGGRPSGVSVLEDLSLITPTNKRHGRLVRPTTVSSGLLPLSVLVPPAGRNSETFVQKTPTHSSEPYTEKGRPKTTRTDESI